MSMRIIEYFSFLVLFGIANAADMDLKALSSAVAQFSAKFCNELDKTTSVVSSPLSAEFILALLTLGTTDSAHEELLTSLGIPNDDSIRSSFLSLSTKLKAIKGVTLNVANKVYIKEGAYELVKELEEDAVKVFDAAIEKVNFGDSVTATNLINKWVEQKTNEKIKNLLTPDSVNNDTRLVLVNALYFKGSWKKKFDARATRDQPFYIDADTKVDVPMMYKEDDYKYGQSEELNAQILEIPYEDNAASMVIVLPNDITGLEGVLQKLAAGHDLVAELDKMWSTKVQVTLPKFKIETEIDLKSVLPKLGIKAIFNSGNSGLTKVLDSNESIFVSKAVQKAFIEVNEEGAEAAAATVMGVRKKRAISSPRAFAVDRAALWCVMAARTPVFALVPRFRPRASLRTEL